MIKYFVANFLAKLSNILLKIVQLLEIGVKLLRGEKIKIITKKYDENRKCYRVFYLNLKNLDERENLFEIFKLVKYDPELKSFSKDKIVIASVIADDTQFNLHPNILIKENNTFEEYFLEAIKHVKTRSKGGYHIDAIDSVHLYIWPADKTFKTPNRPLLLKNSLDLGKRSFSTSPYINKNKQFIKPLNKTSKNINNFIAMDIETVSNENNEQLPIAITLTTMIKNKLIKKLILIDHNLFINNKDLAINKLFDRLLDFLLEYNIKYIFTHNLGSFDGFFIYKYLLNKVKNPNDLNAIIDDQNRFISIDLKILKNNKQFHFIWKDSFRIFPVSLNELCQNFEVDGKITTYDPNWNSLDLFNNQIELELFKEYSLQDSVSLFLALKKAQEIYMNDHLIDITTIWSTSTLSLKIFRSKFLKHNIPILSNHQDNFIRKGYYGGATDCFVKYAENVYPYDVNSLYPYAMKNPMPLNIIKFHSDLTNFKLTDFFGFCRVKVTCPKNILIPLLPFHDLKTGTTIFPTGT
jgi:hypothetical protein